MLLEKSKGCLFYNVQDTPGWMDELAVSHSTRLTISGDEFCGFINKAYEVLSPS